MSTAADLKILAPALAQAREAGGTLVLATMVETAGSSYRKAGARMLMAPDGRWWGLLGGGCFEGDLVERAREALAGPAQIVEYDLREEQDILWGLGAGCEGMIRILLQRLTPDTHYEPLAGAVALARTRRSGLVLTVVNPGESGLFPGDSVIVSGEGVVSATRKAANKALASAAVESLDQAAPRGMKSVSLPDGRADVFVDPLVPPPKFLVAGAGPDAVPMAMIACELGWDVVVADHREGWARPDRFPAGCEVVCLEPRDLEGRMAADPPDAALVMSHHLGVDTRWLEALARLPLKWVGVLGPARRKARLLGDVSPGTREALEGRLRGPVGLDIGGEGPGPIAVSAIAEIQAFLAGRDGRPVGT